MKPIESWEEFLKRHKGTATNQVDWTQRRNEWLAALGALYLKLHMYLAVEKAQGLISIQPSSVQLREDYLGDYEAPAMFIHIGDAVVSVMPRGTLIIGSYGRVDMSGNNDQVMLIRGKDDSWQFAYRKPSGLAYEELNDATFKAWIQKLA